MKNRKNSGYGFGDRAPTLYAPRDSTLDGSTDDDIHMIERNRSADIISEEEWRKKNIKRYSSVCRWLQKRRYAESEY